LFGSDIAVVEPGGGGKQANRHHQGQRTTRRHTNLSDAVHAEPKE
jgi:hypothetical protein